MAVAPGLKLRRQSRLPSRHPAPAIPELAFRSYSAARNPLIPTSLHWAKFIEHGSSGSEIRGVEPLGKPGEDVIQQLAGVTFLALTLPQASKTHCSAQFQRLRLWPPAISSAL